jgi:TATA-box binding protein (TBP) (component of TFIID and TFIIIB)
MKRPFSSLSLCGGGGDDENHDYNFDNDETKNVPCYCHRIQEKQAKISNLFMNHTKKKYNEEQKDQTIEPFYKDIHHSCSLEATHTLDSYFSSNLAMPTYSSEQESSLRTLNLLDKMNNLIDTMDVDDFKEFHTLELLKSLPPMFDMYQLGVKVNTHCTQEAFIEWYTGWKAYEEEKRKSQISYRVSKDEEYIYKEEEQRERLCLKDSNSTTSIELAIENFVYSTHFFNKFTRDPYRFNLNHLAAKFLPFGVQYTKTKFAKIDFRTPWGSLLIFESGGMIETGSKKESISKKLLDHVVNFLRDECGYKNIAVRKRICQNVVLTGRISHGVCLHVLRKKYPFIQYDPIDFTGAIIRMDEVNKHVTSDLSFTDYEENDEDEFEINEDIKNEKEGKQNEDEEVVEEDDDLTLEYSDHYGETHRHSVKIKMDGDEDEIRVKVEDNEEEEEEEFDEDDYDEEEDETIIKMDDLKDENAAKLYAEFLKNTANKSFNKLNQVDNATALTFEKGTLICVGFRSRLEAKRALPKLYPMVKSCSPTPENLAQEKLLASRYVPSDSTAIKSPLSIKKRKRRRSYAKGRKAGGGANVTTTKSTSSRSNKRRKITI